MILFRPRHRECDDGGEIVIHHERSRSCGRERLHAGRENLLLLLSKLANPRLALVGAHGLLEPLRSG